MSGPWTKQAVARALRRLDRQGIWPTTASVRAHLGEAAVEGVAKHFGDARAACKRLEITRPPYDSREAICTALRSAQAKGIVLKPAHLVEAGHGTLVTAIYRYFRDFDEALSAARVEKPKPVTRGLSEAEAAQELLETARRLGRTPRAKDLSFSVTRPLREQHGTYANALRHLGLEPALLPNQRWTRESIAQELRRIHEQGGSTTAHGLSKADRHDLLLGIYRRFPSIGAAREAAGLPARLAQAPLSALNNAAIRKARVRYARGTISQAKLALELGVNFMTVVALLRHDVRPEAGGPKHTPGRAAGKLSARSIVAIRRSYASGSASLSTLASRYEISPSAVRRIVRGETHPHVGGPLTKRRS